METDKEKSTVKLIHQLDKAIHKYMNSLMVDAGIKQGYHDVYVELLQEESLTQNEIATRCGLTRSTVSTTLTNMENDGLIIRCSDENDLRRTNVELSPKGRQIKNEMDKIAASTHKQLTQNIAPDDIEAFRTMVTRMFNNFSDIL